MLVGGIFLLGWLTCSKPWHHPKSGFGPMGNQRIFKNAGIIKAYEGALSHIAERRVEAIRKRNIFLQEAKITVQGGVQ